MKKRIVCLGLLAAVTQLFATGCCCHPIASRWRANHPCGICSKPHPLMHPVQTRRTVQGDPAGPVVTNPPCHGCEGSGSPGAPTIVGPKPGIVAPSGYPVIGYPMPITPGPMVVPSYELPSPMPVVPPKNGGN
jgi:hypothetical protein